MRAAIAPTPAVKTPAGGEWHAFASGDKAPWNANPDCYSYRPSWRTA